MGEALRQDLSRVVRSRPYALATLAVSAYAVYTMVATVLPMGYGIVDEGVARALGPMMRAGGLLGVGGNQLPATALAVAALGDTRFMWVALPAVCSTGVVWGVRSGYVSVRASWGCPWAHQVLSALLAPTAAVLLSLGIAVAASLAAATALSVSPFDQGRLDLLLAALDGQHDLYGRVFDPRYLRDLLLPVSGALLAAWLGVLAGLATLSVPAAAGLPAACVFLGAGPLGRSFAPLGSTAVSGDRWLELLAGTLVAQVAVLAGVAVVAALRGRGGV